MEDLYALIREDASQLESRFRKASIEGRGTPQEIADFRENALQDFVSRFFPFPHRITKGKIRDSQGGISDSVDCVVCNPNHPHTVDSRGKFTLLFAEGVDAAVEVKPDISDKSELERGLSQGLSVKSLRRANTPTLFRMPWAVERSRHVPYVIFAMRCKADPMDTGREILKFFESRGTQPFEQPDFIAVNNVGIFANYVDASLFRWDLDPEPQQKTGWFFEEWRDNTLTGFLLGLQTLAHASIKLDEDVLPRYLFPTGGKTGVHSIRRLTA